MRRFFKIFLIALLALRALVGNAMAYEMTQAMMNEPATVVAQVASQEMSSMPCHTVASDEASSAAHPACTTCQVCHMSAFLPVSLLQVAQALPSEMPALQEAAWFSFDNALVSKPPIL
jgi:hypothetical protein